MMAFVPNSHALGMRLAKAGLLPAECLDIQMLIPVDGLLCFRFHTYLTSPPTINFGKDMTVIGECLKALCPEGAFDMVLAMPCDAPAVLSYTVPALKEQIIIFADVLLDYAHERNV